MPEESDITMAKRTRPNTQEQLEVVFELYKRIPYKHKITAKELQVQLAEVGIERDIRTIHRNLEVLVKYLDIEKDDRDKPYGYQKREHHAFQFGSHEALLIRLAEEHLSNLLPANLMKTFASIFQDARFHLFPNANNQKERQWLKKVKFVSDTQPLLPPKVDSGIVERVSVALYHNRYLHLRYTNADKASKAKEVMPLGLAQQGSRLYLVCRFKGHRNERSLALHRIQSATVSTFTFTYPNDFQLDQYDADGRFGFGEGDMVQLSFDITLKAGHHLYETPLSKAQHIVEHTDHYSVTATVVDSLQLDRWLNSFGSEVVNVNKQPLSVSAGS